MNNEKLIAAIRDGVPLVEPVSVDKAMMAKQPARAVLASGTGPVAAVHLVNIGITGWVHTQETAQAYADGFNRGTDWLRASIVSYAERATPAAASAGAAGTIDTPAFRTLLTELDVAEEAAASYGQPHHEKAATDAYAAFVAHIDQNTAAAVKAETVRLKMKCGEFAEEAFRAEAKLRELRAGQAQATEGGDLTDAQIVAVLASLGIDSEKSKHGFDVLQVHTTVPGIRDIVKAYRAATAPVSAAPTTRIDLHGDYTLQSDGKDWAFNNPDGNLIRWLGEEEQFFIAGALRAALPQSAGAPVSTAPDAWITPQVAQNLDRQYRDGFQAGWTACIDGNEEALGAVLNRVKPLADYQEGAPVSAAPTQVKMPEGGKAYEYSSHLIVVPYVDAQTYGNAMAEVARQETRNYYEAKIADLFGSLPQSAGAPVADSEPAIPIWLQRAFVTLESNDGFYSIVMKFNQRENAFAAHNFLIGYGAKDWPASSAGAPVSAAEPRTAVFMQPDTPTSDTHNPVVVITDYRQPPADGQELPAPTINNLARQHGHAANSGTEGYGHDYFNFTVAELHSFAKALLAMRQPDPACEWVKRADLAMGQHGEDEAARDVMAERRRQVEAEGWTAAHDDKYSNCELARAAATYAVCSHIEQLVLCGEITWPWHPDWWKRTTYRRDLIKSGALILAEIERIDRAAKQAGKKTT